MPVAALPSPSPLLHRALLVDALVSGATGVLLMLAAAPLAGLLGLPQGLLRGAGVALLPFAALVFGLSRRETVPRPGAVLVAAANGLWVVASVALLLTGWVAPTGYGVAFVLAQAAAVAGLAEVQLVGLRRARPVTPA